MPMPQAGGAPRGLTGRPRDETGSWRRWCEERCVWCGVCVKNGVLGWFGGWGDDGERGLGGEGSEQASMQHDGTGEQSRERTRGLEGKKRDLRLCIYLPTPELNEAIYKPCHMFPAACLDRSHVAAGFSPLTRLAPAYVVCVSRGDFDSQESELVGSNGKATATG
jgi:hypothetical protein